MIRVRLGHIGSASTLVCGGAILKTSTPTIALTTTDAATIASATTRSRVLLNEAYLVVWSGGYEAPQYELRLTREGAVETALTWMEDMEEGVDTIDVLRLNLTNLTVERVEGASL
jgi:hypothetical protein